MPAPKSAAHIWLQLLRAPNLFTVPGDPLAGYLLATGGMFDLRAVGVMLASLFAYSAGLLLNDLADLEEDRRERPKRPLPSGAAQPQTVWVVTGVLALASLAVCLLCGKPTLMVGVLLLGVVATYNLRSKKIAGLGPLNMGLCRGLSLLLGASAGLSDQASASVPMAVLVAAVTLTIYIALVTNLARIETEAQPPRGPRVLPFVGLIGAIVPFFFAGLDWKNVLSASNLGLYLISAYTLYAGFRIHLHLNHEPAPPIPPMIGQLIRLLLPLQAIWCVASHSNAGGIAAVVLLGFWPISRAVSRRFYAS